MFDVVWYTPRNKDKAMSLLGRLDREQLADRRKRDGGRGSGLRFWFDHCPIPNAEGKPTMRGTCACIDLYGSSALQPGAIAGDDIKIIAEGAASVAYTEEGLAAGYLNIEALPDIAKVIETEIKVENDASAQVYKDRESMVQMMREAYYGHVKSLRWRWVLVWLWGPVAVVAGLAWFVTHASMWLMSRTMPVLWARFDYEPTPYDWGTEDADPHGAAKRVFGAMRAPLDRECHGRKAKTRQDAKSIEGSLAGCSHA